MGSMFAVSASGLVVTFNTTGIFNFAHGAMGMFMAYLLWQLWQGWGQLYGAISAMVQAEGLSVLMVEQFAEAALAVAQRAAVMVNGRIEVEGFSR